MKFLDTFSGIGGFRLGMEAAGHECIGYVEIDKFARKSYEAIHDTKGEWTAHDITRVTDESIRELKGVDVITGGFPCQAFSVAGKREGFSDTRGTLFFEIARIANILRPRYLFLENVTGLLNHENGDTFETIIRTLDEIGYDAEWSCINSKRFVPQNRERIFIIGHLRGSGGRKVFPFGSENTSAIEIVGRLEGNHDQNSRVYGSGGVSPCLSTMQGGGQEPKILIDDQGRTTKQNELKSVCPTLRAQSHGNEPKVLVNVAQGQLKIRKNNISNCIDANYFKGLDNHQGRIGVMEPIPILTPDRAEKRQNGRRFKEPGEPMFTLTSQDKHGVVVRGNVNPSGNGMNGQVYDSKGLAPTITTNKGEGNKILNQSRIRKLTPRECFRLQGFPDWAFDRAAEVNSDSQLYRQAGNSVTVPVIYEIAKKL